MEEHDFSKQGDKEFHNDIWIKKTRLLNVMESYGKGPARRVCIKSLHGLDTQLKEYRIQKKDYLESFLSIFDMVELWKMLTRKENLAHDSDREEELNSLGDNIMDKADFLKEKYPNNYTRDLNVFEGWPECIDNLSSKYKIEFKVQK